MYCRSCVTHYAFDERKITDKPIKTRVLIKNSPNLDNGRPHRVVNAERRFVLTFLQGPHKVLHRGLGKHTNERRFK